jgi:type IV pilus assembly protein PilP
MTMKRTHTTLAMLSLVGLSLAAIPAVEAQAAPAAPASAPARKAHKKAAAAHAAAAPADQSGAGKTVTAVGRRDPFLPLVNESKQGGPPLPPGKAGLVVATVHIDGTVRSPEGMLAVVSNPDQRVYFLREGDRLYDGDVEKIGLDGVTFKENSKDAFGKPVERLVTKRIYPSAGEQQ